MEFLRSEGSDFPLDRLVDVEAVAAAESGPARVVPLALRGRQAVLANLVVGEQYPFHAVPAAGPLHPVAFDVLARTVEVPEVPPGRREHAVRLHTAQKRS